jgi:hypothetical protein
VEHCGDRTAVGAHLLLGVETDESSTHLAIRIAICAQLSKAGIFTAATIDNTAYGLFSAGTDSMINDLADSDKHLIITLVFFFCTNFIVDYCS